jgi:putative intracellular protease/amidase
MGYPTSSSGISNKDETAYRSCGDCVANFTNGEEEEAKLTKVVAFLVEDELLRQGATFEKLANWQLFSLADGRLITGQNPASSASTAQTLTKRSLNSR